MRRCPAGVLQGGGPIAAFEGTPLAGQVDRARSILAELLAPHTAEGSTVAGRAYIHAGLGELDEAVDLLERAYEMHEGLLVFLKVEPMIDPLR